MNRSRTCRHRVLAAGPTCRVSLCDHETVHLDVGALTLRLSPRQLEAFANTLVAACADLGTSESAGDSQLLC